MGKRNGVTLATVAREAKVSLGTASRVINGEKGVSIEAAEAVRAAMKQMAYSPPPLEHRRGPRSRLRHADVAGGRVVVLLLGPHNLKWILDRSPVYSNVIQGAQGVLGGKGIDLVVRHAPEARDMAEALRTGAITGAILFGIEPPEGVPAEVLKVPTVWVMGSPEKYLGDHIAPNHAMVGSMGAHHLLSQGHRNLAVIGSPPKVVPIATTWVHERCISFTNTIRQAGATVTELYDSHLIREDRNDTDEVKFSALLDRLAALRPRPTGLFLAIDMLCPATYRGLLTRGIVPGRDIQIVSCNNERPFLVGLHPVPAIVDLRTEYVGERAVDRLLWRMKNPTAPSERILIAPRLLLPTE